MGNDETAEAREDAESTDEADPAVEEALPLLPTADELAAEVLEATEAKEDNAEAPEDCA